MNLQKLASRSLVVIITGCTIGCAAQVQVPPISEDWMLSSVQDGNTILVQKDNQSRQVRLACIDIPRNQQLGIKSRDYLRELLPKEKEMAMTFTGKYRGQYIAEIFVPKQGEEETFVQYEMVHAGQAYIYPEDKQNCPNFDVVEKGEDQAKTEKIGVWSR